MRSSVWLSALLLLCVSAPLFAQDRPFTQGTVSVVTSIRVLDGQGDAFMEYLATEYKQVMEAQKKAGNVVDYSVFAARARTPDEPNMYMVVTYPNMAAFDGLMDRTEKVAMEVTGRDRAAARAAGLERDKMRKVLGSELIRKLDLK